MQLTKCGLTLKSSQPTKSFASNVNKSPTYDVDQLANSIASALNVKQNRFHHRKRSSSYGRSNYRRNNNF